MQAQSEGNSVVQPRSPATLFRALDLEWEGRALRL